MKDGEWWVMRLATPTRLFSEFNCTLVTPLSALITSSAAESYGLMTTFFYPFNLNWKGYTLVTARAQNGCECKIKDKYFCRHQAMTNLGFPNEQFPKYYNVLIFLELLNKVLHRDNLTLFKFSCGVRLVRGKLFIFWCG